MVSPSANAGDTGSVLKLGIQIPRRRKLQPTPAFLSGKSIDRGAWRATVYRVTRESDKT